MNSNPDWLRRRLAIFLIFSASFASPAIAQSDTAEPPTQTQDKKQSVATGFFISDGGYLITSHHVVSGYEHIYVVTADRRVLQASLLKVDQPQDLALLKVAAITPFLYLSHSQGRTPRHGGRNHWLPTGRDSWAETKNYQRIGQQQLRFEG